MNKKLMVGALAVALIGGGIVGTTMLPITNAAAPVLKSITSPNRLDQAQQDNDQEVNDDEVQAVTLTKQQVIEIALKQIPGEVTDVQLETENNVAAYSVTVKDSEGTNQEITFDANSGEILPEDD
ncbi:PepSY domain-containing protein [Paenibacillus sp. HB172176]|uniref:PepSY domain-containing protein n=1 Tax=Paenibacillus sp. HB172176 TaxID=2493690 RepID=UPI00143C2B30|nr:PepSY domain-containing protein [Paenibacillus sp. HB172176]